MANSPDESPLSSSAGQPPSSSGHPPAATETGLTRSDNPFSGELPDKDPLAAPTGPPNFESSAVVALNASAVQSTLELQQRLERIQAAQFHAYKRKHVRTVVILFLLTLLSTFVVGANYFPVEYLLGMILPQFGEFLEAACRPLSVTDVLRLSTRQGLEYAIPLMIILFCHEMGHYLQSLKNRVPASLPFFIPLPLPPMGTMGAVIFQARGVATRRQMFDIAVWGPLAGLAVTLPILWYGLSHSQYVPGEDVSSLQLGEPLILQWMISAIHGPAPEGQIFALNSIGFAGWVGILITALNLLPVGQLDGGHILYTLIGRRAHIVAYLVIGAGVVTMAVLRSPAFSLLLILLMLTGPRHPPTANDSEPLGRGRQILGWLTLSFLFIGFTPNPISISEPLPEPPTEEQHETQPPEVAATGVWRMNDQAVCS